MKIAFGSCGNPQRPLPIFDHVLEHQPDLFIFLGDNIYDLGAREAFREEDLAKLSPQLEATRGASNSRAFFLPGNHDWAKGADDARARESIRLQQAWLYELAPDSSARLLPAHGCPGPERVDVVAGVTVLLIDTEWLLRVPDDDCGGEDRFYERLTDLLRIGKLPKDLGLPPISVEHDRFMICGSPSMLKDITRMLDSQGFEESRHGVAAHYVIERAFVES